MARPRPAGTSTKQRLKDAAVAEFAARGFDGAKVDRIASRARVNKAMLYYHFHNKAALYLTILREQFGALARGRGLRARARRAARRTAAPVHRAPSRGKRSPGRVSRRSGSAKSPKAAATWTPPSSGRSGACSTRWPPSSPRASATACSRPRIRWSCRSAWSRPLMFFGASAPFRQRVGRLAPVPAALPTLDDMIAHVQAATLAVLAGPASSGRHQR